MNLPIHKVLPEFFEAFNTSRNIVLLAPPGAGKTTVIPTEIFKQTQQSILILEPRRLAAKQVATRMATMMKENIGETVGYQIKGEKKISSQTKILVITEGILTRFLQSDPELSKFDVIIFDEFHERHLHSDLSLSLCLQSQLYFREDLSLIVMSATLEGEKLSKLMDDAPLIISEGHTFPVDIYYRPGKPQSYYQDTVFHTIQCITEAIANHVGDILVFLPSQKVIFNVESHLKQAVSDHHIDILPLYGNLDFSKQNKAIQASQDGKRKVVLATNIAETSLTIEGIEVVIDSGQMRSNRFSPSHGIDTLEQHMISQGSAIQRAGRAGRVKAGSCYRLYSESQFKQMQFALPAEIAKTDLSGLALDLAHWGVSDITELKWLEPPPNAALSQARSLLLSLGAITKKHQITNYGKELLNIGLHPRLAHMLLQSLQYGLSEDACIIAALLSERDPLSLKEYGADIHLRLDTIKANKKIGNHQHKQIYRQAQSYQSLLNKIRVAKSSKLTSSLNTPIGFLLSLAYPERIAKLQNEPEKRYKLSSGRGARLFFDDDLCRHQWLAVGTTQIQNNEAVIQLAAHVDIEDIKTHSPERIQNTLNIKWDKKRKASFAIRESRIGDIIVQSRVESDADKMHLQKALIDHLKSSQLADIKWDKKTHKLLAKIDILNQAKENGIDHNLTFPECDRSSLSSNIDNWLSPHLNGVSSIAKLNQSDFFTMFIAYLGWDTVQQIEALLPDNLKVPSGSNIAINYDSYPPILAVRLQEMFGCHATPSLINNKLPLLIHLLSPAHRPIQITQDLSSFWSNAYHEVRKELRIKYKKHYWPEDPHDAQPTNKIKRKM